jgi:oxygen-independent coproporphyrinogen-3 oxidase
MSTAPISSSEIAALVEVLGDAPRVSYAPPAIYPMSAPVFDPATEWDRGDPPPGPIGIYAHVPFCSYKCTFCFYATRPVPDAAEMSRYVAALERELGWLPEGTPLSQLYVGGGTPTTLPPELLDRLLETIRTRTRRGDAVDTVECSPDSIRSEHVDALRRHGVERVSMGVQSGSEGIRRSINRRHDDRQVLEACELLVGSGLVVNVDLIYGLPGQTPDDFRSDFEEVARRGVHSLTCYNLRINETTPIGRRLAPGDRLDAVALVRWRELARRVAEDLGFRQTRWHTYQRVECATARDAADRFRDLTGWGHQLGVGVSARSRLRDTVFRNHRRFEDYLERVESGRSPVEERKPLDAFEQRLRFVTLTLGEGRSLERATYREAFGTPFDADFGGPLERLRGAGVVSDDGTRVRISDRGKLVYDLATRAFYPDGVLRWVEERQRLADTSSNLRPRPA